METNDKIERLKEKKGQIEKRLATLQAKERAQQRKEQTRLKVLIGGGIMADAKHHPEVMELVQEILTRATTAKRDREFLRSMGWLPPASARGKEEGS